MLGNHFPQKAFIDWFVENQRKLPWRTEATPYRVWISEIMLQQTQVAVVLPYFERWMEAFPTIEALSKAHIDQVLKLWEGLGYYSRARNIHAAAQYLIQHHAGQLPDSEEALSKIKGIGPYTVGAIRSFAFHQKTAAVDGNVLRVMSRFFAIEDEIDHFATQKHIRQLAQELLPDEKSWLVTEGLIELGATICTKQPKCSQCPLMQSCLAFRKGKAAELPKRRPRQKTLELHRQVAVVLAEEHVLVRKGEKGKVMADLYEFPYVESGDGRAPATLFAETLGLELHYRHPLEKEQHSFTRYRVHLYPHLFEAARRDARHHWQPTEKLQELPFSSGHRRILGRLNFS